MREPQSSPAVGQSLPCGTLQQGDDSGWYLAPGTRQQDVKALLAQDGDLLALGSAVGARENKRQALRGQAQH